MADYILSLPGEEIDKFFRQRALRIAVLGDSFTVNPGYGLNWPKVLEHSMLLSGVPAHIFHIAHGAWTYRKAASADSADQIFGDMNSLDYLIELAPDIAIVCLGFNDIFTDSTDTLAGVKLNAENVLDTIRLQLQDTFVIYATPMIYDKVNFPSGTTKNKGVIPYLQNIPLGIDMANESRLETNLDATIQGQLDDFRALDAHVKSYISSTFPVTMHSQFDLDVWRTSRLGFSHDGLHIDIAGQRFLSAYSYQHFKNTSQIHDKFPRVAKLGLYNYIHNPDLLWGYGMSTSGDGYTINTTLNPWVHWCRAQGFNAHDLERRWFRTEHETLTPVVKINRTSFDLAKKPPYGWSIKDARPYQPIYLAVDGVDKGQIGTTDAYGGASSTGDAHDSLRFIGADTPGTYDLTYSVGVHSETITITVVNSQRKVFSSVENNESTTSTSVWKNAGLSAAITPWNAGNRVFIRGSLNLGLIPTSGINGANMDVRLLRGATEIARWRALGIDEADTLVVQCSFEFMDWPVSTTEQTYSWQFKLGDTSPAGTAYVGGVGGRLSTMTLEQIESVG